MGNYVLITPVKNEEATIKKVLASVKQQTLRPLAWIIVNDGSTDNTEAILSAEAADTNWIFVLNKVVNTEYNWLGITRVLNTALQYLNQSIAKGEISDDFDFLGVLDADITLEENYFKILADELERDSSLASISGNVFVKKGGKWLAENYREDPRGGARLYRFKTFLDIGGFPKTPSWDSVSDVRFKVRGFKVKRVQDLRAFQHRETFSKESRLRGFFLTGKVRYILYYNFLYTLIGSVYTGLTTTPYVLSGLAMFWGYLWSFFTRVERIYDPDFVKYKNSIRRILERSN